MRSHTRRAAAAAFALALAATSCAGGTDTADTATTGSTAADVVAPATTAPVPAAEQSSPAQDEAPTPPGEVAPAEAAEPTTTPESPAPEPVAAVTVQLPNVDVVELSTGQTSDLAGFARPGAMLVWFWAPN